jgi:hypothetical protein
MGHEVGFRGQKHPYMDDLFPAFVDDPGLFHNPLANKEAEIGGFWYGYARQWKTLHVREQVVDGFLEFSDFRWRVVALVMRKDIHKIGLRTIEV